MGVPERSVADLQIDREGASLSIAVINRNSGGSMHSTPSKLVTALALACLAAPALAQGPRVFAYESKANYCPAGLQPVTLNGAICCGVPNQAQTYQQAMRHPISTRVHHVARSARPSYDRCPPGVKGCD
jgi:hypothetical protein